MNYELWMFSIPLLFVDFIHFEYTSFENIGDYSYTDFIDSTFFHRVMFYSIQIITLTLFISKIEKYIVG